METEKIGRKFDDGIHLEYETCEKNSDDRSSDSDVLWPPILENVCQVFVFVLCDNFVTELIISVLKFKFTCAKLAWPTILVVTMEKVCLCLCHCLIR